MFFFGSQQMLMSALLIRVQMETARMVLKHTGARVMTATQAQTVRQISMSAALIRAWTATVLIR